MRRKSFMCRRSAMKDERSSLQQTEGFVYGQKEEEEALLTKNSFRSRRTVDQVEPSNTTFSNIHHRR